MSAAMQRNSRDTLTNTLKSILFVSGLRQMRVVTWHIPTYEKMNFVHSNSQTKTGLMSSGEPTKPQQSLLRHL